MRNTRVKIKYKCKICKKYLVRGAYYCSECESFQGKPCDVCSHPLPSLNARYCTKCNKYQNWWLRQLVSLPASAIVSAVPLLVIFITFVQLNFQGSYSKVIAAPARCDSNVIEVFARNTGTKPAIIHRKARYSTLIEDDEPRIGTLVLSDEGAPSSLLQGNTGDRFSFRTELVAGSPIDMFAVDMSKKCRVNAWLSIVHFGGDREEVPFTCECGN